MTARLWTLLGAIGAIAILVGAWLLGVSPRLDEAATADSSREQAVAQNAILASELERLEAQFESIDQLRSNLDELQQSLPPELRSADFVRQLNGLAEQAGVTLNSITIQGAGVFVPSGGSVVEDAAEPATDGSGSPAIEAPSSEIDPIQTVPVAPGVDADNFVLVPIAIEATGAYDSLVAFLDAVQSGTRLVLVETAGISTDPPQEDADGALPSSRLSLGGTVFVLLSEPVNTPTDG